MSPKHTFFPDCTTWFSGHQVALHCLHRLLPGILTGIKLAHEKRNTNTHKCKMFPTIQYLSCHLHCSFNPTCFDFDGNFQTIFWTWIKTLSCWYLGPLIMTESGITTKHPKANRGLIQSTANRTSQCMKQSPGPPPCHIQIALHHAGGSTKCGKLLTSLSKN